MKSPILIRPRRKKERGKGGREIRKKEGVDRKERVSFIFKVLDILKSTL